MNFKLANLFKGDKGIWMIFFFLCVISIMEVFSAASGLTYRSGDYLAPMIKHVGTIVAGLFAMLIVLNIPCRLYTKAIPYYYLLSLGLLIAVLFVGDEANEATRQLTILGFSVQPSEIAKGALILATASILSFQTPQGAQRYAAKWIVVFSIPLILLILKENFSTAFLVTLVLLLMMFIGRVCARHMLRILAVLGCVGIIGVSILIYFGDEKKPEAAEVAKTEMQVGDDSNAATTTKKEKGAIEKILHRIPTWRHRLLAFTDTLPSKPEYYKVTDKNKQVTYANVAIVNSEMWGQGPGNSVARDFLPQAYSDFIYAIIIEELGIEGAAFVLMLYLWLLFRAARIARRCESTFPALLIMGIALMFVVQAMFNMCVAVGLGPVTGQPLPLISRGGSSIIMYCVYMGAMLSVSRTAKKKQAEAIIENRQPTTEETAE